MDGQIGAANMAENGTIREMNIHGSCVAFDLGPKTLEGADSAPHAKGGEGGARRERAAVLILGPSGAGKSTLALALMAIGGELVADDRTDLSVSQGRLIADCPPALRGMIEARGLGVLAATYNGPSEVTLLVDLGATEPQRLPLAAERALLGIGLPLVKGPMRPHFASAVRQLLLKGRAI